MATEEHTTKTCTKCKQIFPATDEFFYREKKSGKLYYTCKKCNIQITRATQKRYSVLDRANIVLQEKRCYRCRIILPIQEFSKNNSTKDGFDPKCRKCAKAIFAEYYAKNADSLRSQKRESTKQYREMNPEKARMAVRDSLKRHPETLRRAHQLREARENNVPYVWEEAFEQFARSYWYNCCAYCGTTDGFWHFIAMDHFIPLRDANCPGTVAENMIPACHTKKGSPKGTPCCNVSKKGKNPHDWLVQKFGHRKAKAKSLIIEQFFQAAKSFAETFYKGVVD